MGDKDGASVHFAPSPVGQVLVVVDSGPHPSPFFTQLCDNRVRYVHIATNDETAISIGTKRYAQSL